MFITEVKSRIGEDISILVKLENHSWNYICECGDARDLSVKEIQNCNAIFISHTHIDHFVNFDSIIRHQIGIQRRVIICGPKNIAKQIEARLKSYTWNLIQEGAIIYEIREMISENEIRIYEIQPPIWELKEIGIKTGNLVFESDLFTVSSILLDHKIPTMAYKFTESDSLNIELKSSGFKGGKWIVDLKNAFMNNADDQVIMVNSIEYNAKDLFYLLIEKKGDTLGIIMDHAASDENHTKIQTHFQSCNTVCIESFYKKADRELADKNYHSFSEASAAVLRKSEVKNAIPVHFSRKYITEQILELIEEFTLVFEK